MQHILFSVILSRISISVSIFYSSHSSRKFEGENNHVFCFVRNTKMQILGHFSRMIGKKSTDTKFFTFLKKIQENFVGHFHKINNVRYIFSDILSYTKNLICKFNVRSIKRWVIPFLIFFVWGISKIFILFSMECVLLFCACVCGVGH